MLLPKTREALYDLVVRTAVVAAIFVFVSIARGASLDSYQQRLASAHASVRSLLKADPAAGQIEKIQRDAIEQIRGALPPQLAVDWTGGSMAVDSTWLHGELDAFAGEVNLSKQYVILARIDERLEAIESAVTEAATAAKGEPSKDNDKTKLAEILARQEYQKPAAETESVFQRWRRQIIEWLSKMFPAIHIEPRQAAGMGSLATVLQILLYLLLAAGILFLLYRFVPYFANRRKRAKPGAQNERVILGERIAADTSAADLFAEAEQFARGGDLRLAIRKGYMALLCELNDRKVIGLARHKTNRDYLRDLRPRQDLLENVRGLTGSFERHWYGSEASVEKDWDEFRTLYRETVGKA